MKVDYSPTERVNVFVRGGYFSEERDNAKIERGQRHEVEVGQRRRARDAARPERPAGAVFVDDKTFTATSWRWRAERHGRRAQHRPHDAPSEGADRRRRHDGAVVEADRHDRTSSAPAPTGGTSTAPASRTPTSHAGCADRATDGAGHALAARIRAARRSAAGAFVQDVFCRTQPRADAQRPRRQLAELQRPHLETTVATGLPTPATAIRCPRRTTPCSARARRRSTASRTRVGRGATSAGASARRRSTSSIVSSASGASGRWPTRARSGAAGRRRARRQTRAGSNIVGPLDVVRQPRQEPGVERHASDRTPSSGRTSGARASRDGRTTSRYA